MGRRGQPDLDMCMDGFARKEPGQTHRQEGKLRPDCFYGGRKKRCCGDPRAWALLLQDEETDPRKARPDGAGCGEQTDRAGGGGCMEPH